METFLWIAGAVLALNAVVICLLVLLNIEDDRRWRREHGGRSGKRN